MTLPITPLFARPLIALRAVLWMGVTPARGPVSFSTGDSPEVLPKVRRHGNVIEWLTIALPLTALAEASGRSPGWLSAAGGLLPPGRIARPI